MSYVWDNSFAVKTASLPKLLGWKWKDSKHNGEIIAVNEITFSIKIPPVKGVIVFTYFMEKPR